MLRLIWALALFGQDVAEVWPRRFLNIGVVLLLEMGFGKMVVLIRLLSVLVELFVVVLLGRFVVVGVFFWVCRGFVERRPSFVLLGMLVLGHIEVCCNWLVINVEFHPGLFGGFWGRREVFLIHTCRAMLVQEDRGWMRPTLFYAQRRLLIFFVRGALRLVFIPLMIKHLVVRRRNRLQKVDLLLRLRVLLVLIKRL